MDAIEVLEEEQREAAELVERLQITAPSRGRTQLFEQLRRCLEQHLSVEERFLLARLAQQAEDDRFLARCYQEHERLDDHLIAMTGCEGDEWPGCLAQLVEYLRRHREQERALFARARALLAPAELQEMGRRMAGMKRSFPAVA